MSDFHPDLRSAARFSPRSMVTPYTLPLLRGATRLMDRRAADDIEVLTLSSGVGVRLHRPPSGTGPGRAWCGFMAVGTCWVALPRTT